jgi:hypothetical protein
MLILSLIIFSIIITFLYFYWQKKYNEQVNQRLSKEVESYIEEILKSKSLKPISTHLILKEDELAFLQCQSILKEPRAVRHYQSGHSGIRIVKGFYIGKSSGTSQSQEELKSIDRGTLTLTNRRLVFNGFSNSRNMPLSKLIKVHSFQDAISVSIDSKQKNSILVVSNPLIWEFTVRLLLNVQNPLELTNIEIEKIKWDTNDKSPEQSNLKSDNNQSTVPIQNLSADFSNSNKKYISSLQDKYIEKRDNLLLKFRLGYDFLKYLENNDRDIWISTAVNAHLYLRNNYLAYIVLNDDSLSLRAKFNNQICSGTTDKSQNMFSNHFIDLILSQDGFNKGWVIKQDEFYILTKSTPNNFLLSLIDYFSKLELD